MVFSRTGEPATPECTQLPRLSLRIGGSDSFSAYVSEAVVSKTPHEMAVRGRGCLYALYHASLVAAAGQNSALQALYAGLVNNPPATLYLEGVGEVMLFSHRLDLVEQGYSDLHWTYRQQRVTLPPATAGTKAIRALQGVLECEAATHFDPLAAEQQALRSRGNEGVTTKKGKKPSDNLTFSTARRAEIKEKLAGAQAASRGLTPTTTVVQQRAQKPLFLLFAPGSWAAQGLDASAQEERLAQLYLSFLDKRFELPLLSEWALPLYRAALADAAIEPLLVKGYPQSILSDGAQMVPLPEGGQPFIREAYLCRPDLSRVMQHVMALVRREREREEEPIMIDSFRSSEARELVEIGA